jgi:hypothetical protein
MLMRVPLRSCRAVRDRAEVGRAHEAMTKARKGPWPLRALLLDAGALLLFGYARDRAREPVSEQRVEGAVQGFVEGSSGDL